MKTIKTFTHWINESQNFRPITNHELKDLIKNEIAKQGNEADLNHIDVSQVTDMTWMFYESQFNGDISKWNVRRVTIMSNMFYKSKFNGDISKWNVSQVTDMYRMFSESQFNGDISGWNVRASVNTVSAFSKSQFNGDISEWNIALERKAVLYSQMKAFRGFELEFIEKLISIAIKKGVPLSGETLNKPPFVTRATSNKFGL